MANPFVIALGKTVRLLARMRASGTGGGSALPGYVVERVSPRFADSILKSLPHGVVIITGTNGKTTTTKIISELLAAQGLRVFANTSGANLMRGVTSSLIAEVSLFGRLDADIAVLELDEAHAVHIARALRPRYSVLLNVMADQTDRFGGVAQTADLLAVVAANTTGTVVLNREDRWLAALPHREEFKPDAPGQTQAIKAPGEAIDAEIRWFGLAPELAARFSLSERASVSESASADVELLAIEGQAATFVIDGAEYSADLALKGIYNAQNAAAALACVRAILQGEGLPQASDTGVLLKALAHVQSAFGRGEAITIDGREVELLLVKNPGGFKLALDSFDPTGHATMIAVSDHYGDGRDMSWLYEVSFGSLKNTGVAMVSGIRAFDLALRLAYDEIAVTAIECDVATALHVLLADNPQLPCRIYCCYTAMLELRKQLAAAIKSSASQA